MSAAEPCHRVPFPLCAFCVGLPWRWAPPTDIFHLISERLWPLSVLEQSRGRYHAEVSLRCHGLPGPSPLHSACNVLKHLKVGMRLMPVICSTVSCRTEHFSGVLIPWLLAVVPVRQELPMAAEVHEPSLCGWHVHKCARSTCLNMALAAFFASARAFSGGLCVVAKAFRSWTQ